MKKTIIKFSVMTFVALPAAAALAEANNSEVNQRDRAATELTAQDQGNSQKDIELTAKIRRDIVAQDELSTDAKNIKIITVNGTVTLKGPVASKAEKKQVELIASRAAGSHHVVSQIDIE